MIQTTIVPENTTVMITIPNSYVGKKVHALVYIDEEITIADDAESLQKTSNDVAINHEGRDETQKQKLGAKREPIEISPLVQSLTGVIPDVDTANDDYYTFLTQKYS